jgi:hypothetical protein
VNENASCEGPRFDSPLRLQEIRLQRIGCLGFFGSDLLSRASYRKMVQNLVWATGYNAVALPLAAGVLAPWGIVLAPAVGALLMSASTVVVAFNAQLLRRDPRLQPTDATNSRDSSID